MEVKNKYAYVIVQDICNKSIEVIFCAGCMVSRPNCLLQDLTTMSLINKIISLKFHRIIFSILCMIRRKPKTNRCNIDHGSLLWTEGYSGHAALCGLFFGYFTTRIYRFSLYSFRHWKISSLK